MAFFQKNHLLQAIILASAASLVACGGSDGKDGKDGINGVTTTTTVDGAPGAPGADGADGADGANGADGADGSNGADGKVPFAKFIGVDAPQTDADKREIFVSQVLVDGKFYGGEYHTLARSGTEITGVTFGQLVDETGTVLTEEDGSIRVSDSNEYASLLPVGDKLFSVSQFESRPGAMFLMELDQNAENGALTVKTLSQIDQSGIDGGWVHCAGSVTPWTTHLASEEYEPDAKTYPTSAEAAGNSMLDYYTDDTQWNPYFYGWNIEIEVNEDATTEVTKHYAMGRLAFELSKVMPDSKTVYMTDDGTNVGLYMFIADTAGDLSAGTTYAAKWNQTSAEGAGSANLTWVLLGHATDAEISDYVHGTNGKTKVTFNDIFDSEAPTNESCSNGFTSISANGIGQECLKVKVGMEKVASRLEARRFAAIQGATTEFRKEEGITYDSKRHKIYVGMSEISNGMLAGNSKDIGGPDHIQLDEQNKCGAVYEMELRSNSEMGSDYVARNMKGLILGRPIAGKGYGNPGEEQVAGFEDNNKCHIDGIANPDNVVYVSGYDALIVGEDTGSGHQNDVIWAYDFAEKGLTRIQTTPYGAETTSPYWYPNINGWSYLTSVVQHPYGESDGDKNTGAGEARAYTGYIGPFPAVNVQ